MKKRQFFAAVLAAAALAMASCGQEAMPEQTGPAATEAAEITTTEEIGDSEAMKAFQDKLEQYRQSGEQDGAAAAEALALYNALTADEKSTVPYGDFDGLTELAYRTACADLLADIENHRQDVIAAVAKAYYDQCYRTREVSGSAPQTLYDQYNSRRNYNIAPEEATGQKNMYLDCSAFVSSVYYYTFGANLLSGKSVSTANLNTEFSAKTPDREGELMYFITGAELAALKADSAKAAEKIAEIKASLQPGDVINYRRSTGTGHVVMYLGNQKIIHSTGTANPKASTGEVDPKTSIEKNAVDEKVFGTVNIDDWDRFFTKTVTPKSQKDGRSSTSNSYLFADNISDIAIFRPTSEKNGRFKNRKLTDGAIDHYLYQGIDIEKTAKTVNGETTSVLCYGNSVFAGDEITYKVIIRNNSDKEMKALTVRETVPDALEYVGCCEDAAYFAEKNIIAMYIASVAPGKTAEFTYTLKVKDGIAGGTVISDAKTYVNAIRANTLVNQYCAVSLDAAALGEAIKGITGQKYADGLAASQAVYAALTGGSGFDCIASQSSPKNVIDVYLKGNVLCNTEKNGQMVVSTLYGGYKVGSAEISAANKNAGYDSVNVRVRRVMKTYLEDGDIIVTYSSFLKEYRAVLYCDEILYGILADGTFGKLPASGLSSGGAGTVQDYLDTLTAYNNFVVLRPALKG